MERWNVGILGIEGGESVPFGSGALHLRTALLGQGAENSLASASSLRQADAPPTSFRVIPISGHFGTEGGFSLRLPFPLATNPDF
jgi:hypothetical protein